MGVAISWTVSLHQVISPLLTTALRDELFMSQLGEVLAGDKKYGSSSVKWAGSAYHEALKM